MKKEVSLLYKIIDENDISAEQLLDLILNYYGTQLINSEFIDFIEEEGYDTLKIGGR